MPGNASKAFQSEAGFSLFKLLFWLALWGGVILNGALIAQAYYNNSKVQDCFESLTRMMPTAEESEVRTKMDALFRLQYLDPDDFPAVFYEKLQINATGHGLEVSSLYHVTVWPFGKVEAVDETGEYDPEHLSGMDILKDKIRIDLSFTPYAISVVGDQ